MSGDGDAFDTAQREAVFHRDGPLAVLSGPGSGKTRVIAGRAVQLVRSGVPPSRILTVTFTRKAAEEARTRISSALGQALTSAMPVGTIHSQALTLLRSAADRLPQGIEFELLQEEAQGPLLRDLLAEIGFKGDVDRTLLRGVAATLGRFKSECVRSSEGAKLQQLCDRLAAETEPVVVDLARRLYPVYQDRLRRLGRLDFGDLLLSSIDLMEAHPGLAVAWRRLQSHIQVDEAQDTTPCMDRWFTLLAAGHRNLALVGDDDQAIHGWAGAIPGYLPAFAERWQAKVVRLDRNYRSAPAILEAAESLMAAGSTRRAGAMRACGPQADNAARPRILCFPDADAEASAIPDLIRDADGDSVFCLYRCGFQSRRIEEALGRAGVRYRLIGALPFYRRAEVLDALAWVRLMLDPTDRDAWERVLSRPRRGIGEVAREAILAGAGAGGDLLEAGRSADLTARAREGAVALADLRTEERLSDLAGGQSPASTLAMLLGDSGYLAMLRESDDPGDAERLDNVIELVEFAGRFADAEALLAHADRMAQASQDEAGDGGVAVQLMTLHASKGSEADTVLLSGWSEGLFPPKRAAESIADGHDSVLEAERRLGYVGLTRARRRCLILSEEGAQSRLLADLPDWVERQSLAGGPSDRPPTPKMLRFAEVIRDRLGEHPGPDILACRRRMSAWIDLHKVRLPRRAAGGG